MFYSICILRNMRQRADRDMMNLLRVGRKPLGL